MYNFAGIPRPASQGDLAERSMSAGWSSDRDDEEGSKMTSPSFGGTATIGNKKCCDGLLLDVSHSVAQRAEYLRFGSSAEANQHML